MVLDIAKIRSHFPALAEGAAHFDGPGGTQTPDVVARAVAEALTSAVANRGVVTMAERRAEEIVGSFRSALADLLGADPRGVVFGRSSTAITYDLSRAIARTWAPGDEVVVTKLDHDSNIRPWVQAAEAAGARVRWAEFDAATGELTVDHIAEQLSERTRLVAVTAASNLIGTRPPVVQIGKRVKEVGALYWVDGVHATAHASVDTQALGVDVWTCSPYKFLGPHCGAAAADPAFLETLQIDKLLPSSDEVPERFELGTLPYELMAGTATAVDYLADLAGGGDMDSHRRDRLADSFTALGHHEDRLFKRLRARLRSIDRVRVVVDPPARTPTLLFTVDGMESQEVRRALALKGINAPAGHFYALECSRHLGLGDEGAVRVGIAPYNNDDDIERLLAALTELAAA